MSTTSINKEALSNKAMYGSISQINQWSDTEQENDQDFAEYQSPEELIHKEDAPIVQSSKISAQARSESTSSPNRAIFLDPLPSTSP